MRVRAARLQLALAALAAGLGIVGSAAAEPAAAEALFRDGRRLLKEGRLEEACLKLSESHALDPASGTLINLALCEERRGRVATAWALYRSVVALARRDGRRDRERVAAKRAAELEPRLPRILVRARQPRAGLVVRWAGIELGQGALGTAIAVDPGTYHLTASAPGYAGWSTTLEIAERQTITLEIPELEPLRSSGSRATPTTSPGTPPPSALGAQRPAPPPRDTVAARLGPWGITLGSIGVLSLGVGTYFGVSSLAAYADAKSECPTRSGCSESAVNSRNDAETKAWLANIGLGVGLVAAASTAWLLLRPIETRAAEVRVQPWVATGGTGVLLAVTR